MAKNSAKAEFLQAKEDTTYNLETIRESLVRCVSEGMIDEDDAYYNELLGLMDEAAIAGEWDEILEVITKAKTLENDVSGWMARHGRSNMSLLWPKNQSKF